MMSTFTTGEEGANGVPLPKADFGFIFLRTAGIAAGDPGTLLENARRGCLTDRAGFCTGVGGGDGESGVCYVFDLDKGVGTIRFPLVVVVRNINDTVPTSSIREHLFMELA
ncbi:unnamed protein product [Somion occarium]|uniref:Uncharacterized protein n=1 Tax=Somion occarium TaxID=3059160 RepID=A0ABP1D2M0_9APHY